MKNLIPFIACLLFTGSAFAADKPAAPKKKEKVLASEVRPFTEEEKAMIEEGERLIREAQKNPQGKPVPKEFMDKMNSGAPTE